MAPGFYRCGEGLAEEPLALHDVLARGVRLGFGKSCSVTDARFVYDAIHKQSPGVSSRSTHLVAARGHLGLDAEGWNNGGKRGSLGTLRKDDEEKELMKRQSCSESKLRSRHARNPFLSREETYYTRVLSTAVWSAEIWWR